MNADGSNPTIVSAALNYALYPSWSPDGSRLAFNDDENRDGTLDVAIINRNGTGLTHPLGYAPTNTDYRAPVWSPDGLQVAFAMIHRTGSSNWDQARLYALTLATNSLRQMTPGNKEWWVDWQTTDVTPPSSNVTAPALAASLNFAVAWSAVESTIAALKRPFNNDQLPVRGRYRVNQMIVGSAFMVNLRRIHRYINQTIMQARANVGATESEATAPALAASFQ